MDEIREQVRKLKITFKNIYLWKRSFLFQLQKWQAMIL